MAVRPPQCPSNRAGEWEKHSGRSWTRRSRPRTRQGRKGCCPRHLPRRQMVPRFPRLAGCLRRSHHFHSSPCRRFHCSSHCFHWCRHLYYPSRRTWHHHCLRPLRHPAPSCAQPAAPSRGRPGLEGGASYGEENGHGAGNWTTRSRRRSFFSAISRPVVIQQSEWHGKTVISPVRRVFKKWTAELAQPPHPRKPFSIPNSALRTPH